MPEIRMAAVVGFALWMAAARGNWVVMLVPVGWFAVLGFAIADEWFGKWEGE